MFAELPIPDLSTETPRLLVRSLRPSDRDELLRVHAISEAHFAPWWPTREDGRTLAEHIDLLIERARTRAADGTGVRLLGLLKEPGRMGEPTRLAAMLNLNNLVRGVFQNADAGWSVSIDCVGCGLGTEGVGAMLNLAFAPPPRGLGLHRVQANIIPRNTASVRLAEKCGFRREGLARDMLKIAGRWQDHAMYAKLDGEHSSPSGA